MPEPIELLRNNPAIKTEETAMEVTKNNYFSDCPRDTTGHCLDKNSVPGTPDKPKEPKAPSSAVDTDSTGGKDKKKKKKKKKPTFVDSDTVLTGPRAEKSLSSCGCTSCKENLPCCGADNKEKEMSSVDNNTGGALIGAKKPGEEVTKENLSDCPRDEVGNCLAKNTAKVAEVAEEPKVPEEPSVEEKRFKLHYQLTEHGVTKTLSLEMGEAHPEFSFNFHLRKENKVHDNCYYKSLSEAERMLARLNANGA